jgi:hypothetical protein
MWGLLVKDKNTMCTRKEWKHNFISTTYEKINMKWKKQGHGARSYFELMFYKFKIMKETSFIYICWRPSWMKLSKKLPYAPTSK